MAIKIDIDETLTNYIAEVKINGCLLTKEQLQQYEINNDVIDILVSFRYEADDQKRSFFQKIFLYIFSFLYIYFISLDDFLDSNEYSSKITINNLERNEDLNIFLKKDNGELSFEILNNNCNIVERKIEKSINQKKFISQLKEYRTLCFISAMVILIIPGYFLIMSLIHQLYNMSLCMIILETILIIFLSVLLTLINKKIEKKIEKDNNLKQ